MPAVNRFRRAPSHRVRSIPSEDLVVMSGDSSRNATRAALSVAVGLVLADSSVVVLALPEIYRDFNVSVNAVIWVLVAFNLVLAAAAVPAALAARRAGPGAGDVGGARRFRPRRPSLRRLALARAADRRSLPAGHRRRRRGHGRTRAPAVRGRLGAPSGHRLGDGRRDRRRPRAGSRRGAHRARLLAVDLPGPGADGDRRRDPGARRGPPGVDRRVTTRRDSRDGPAAPRRRTSPWGWSRRRSRRRSS